MLGEDHRITLEEKIELARAMIALGERAGAEKLYERVLRDQEATLGERHPSTLATKFA